MIASIRAGARSASLFLWEEETLLKGLQFKQPVKEKGEGSENAASNQKERLFDLLIHDLAGPLAIASTSTANLLHKAERYGALSESQKRVLERIERNVEKAQNLLHEMIEILRSEEGLFQRDFFLIEKTVQDSLLDALEMHTPHAAEKLCLVHGPEEFQSCLKEYGINVEITGKYCHSPFCHDQKKIRQILRNLIGNALKYRRERLGVMICGEADLVIAVEDDGVGIPLPDQEAIFGRFVRLKDDRRPNVPGLGLGLTGVKTLVGAMGGEISLESREGVGTRFTVRIPSSPPSPHRDKEGAL
jgi:signal transduction histidine kinase